jgi:hypothetical protein
MFCTYNYLAFPLTSALYIGYLAKTDEWNMSTGHWWNNDKIKPKHPEQNSYQWQSTMNPTQNSMASDLNLHSDRPMTNHLSHGTAHLDDTYTDAGGHVA